jgi:hypothetical protein
MPLPLTIAACENFGGTTYKDDAIESSGITVSVHELPLANMLTVSREGRDSANLIRLPLSSDGINLEGDSK